MSDITTIAPGTVEYGRLRTNLSSKYSKRCKKAAELGLDPDEYMRTLPDYDRFVDELKHFQVGPYKTSDHAQTKAAEMTSKAGKSRVTKAFRIPTSSRLDQIMSDVEIDVVNMEDVMMTDAHFGTVKTGTVFDELVSIDGGLKYGTTYIMPGESGAGKTSVATAIMVNMIEMNPEMRDDIGFGSAEMQVQDWREECRHNPTLSVLPIIFMKKMLRDRQGEDFLAAIKKMLMSFKFMVVDSFEVVKSKITENTELSSKDAENWLLSTFEDLNELGHTYIVIQHMNKSGEYTGSTRIKHDPTGMIVVRFDDEGQRYLMFTKNRRNGGDINKPLYFTKNRQTGRIEFDEAKYRRQQQANEFSRQAEERQVEDEDWLAKEYASLMQEEASGQPDATPNDVDPAQLEMMHAGLAAMTEDFDGVDA